MTERLLEGEIAGKFLGAILAQPRVKRLLSSDHFSVDGTLIKARASTKSFAGSTAATTIRKARAATSSAASTRKSAPTRPTKAPPIRMRGCIARATGQPARLCYLGHALMENRNGLAVGGVVTQATGTAECEAAPALVDARPGRSQGRSPQRITLGADKAYNVTAFVEDLRARSVSPHIAINGHLTKTGKRRKSAIYNRTTRHAGYAVSQRCRKRIEEIFGWLKSAASMAKTKFRGRSRVDAAFTMGLAAYNLIRIPKLLAAA